MNKTIKMVGLGAIVLIIGILVGSSINSKPEAEEQEVKPPGLTMEDFDTDESQFSYEVSDEGVTINGYSKEYKKFLFDERKGDYDNMVIPSTLEGHQVVAIADEAFLHNGAMTLKLPDGLKTIGASSFSGMLINSVKIPDSVEYIGAGAFSGNRMADLELSKSLTYIGEGAFKTNALVSITIPGSVKEIGARAFERNKLESLIMEEGVEIIGERSFLSNKLTYIRIPDSVLEIREDAFLFNVKSDDIFDLTNYRLHATVLEGDRERWTDCDSEIHTVTPLYLRGYEFELAWVNENNAMSDAELGSHLAKCLPKE